MIRISFVAALLTVTGSIASADVVEKIVKDAHGSPLAHAHCGVKTWEGHAFPVIADRSGKITYSAREGATIHCLDDKKAVHEGKHGSGKEIKMTPTPLGGGCGAYNLIPYPGGKIACVNDQACRWSGGSIGALCA